MAQLSQTFLSENCKPRFSSMSQKSEIVFNFFPIISRGQSMPSLSLCIYKSVAVSLSIVSLTISMFWVICLSLSDSVRFPLSVCLCHSVPVRLLQVPSSSLSFNLYCLEYYCYYCYFLFRFLIFFIK